ncbi:uncharacterized protein LOC143517066 [Brachyhypopomus gauderio]|uniref:uncharacterized protein LOC143517066 n=1 Tax=Brachyhypopomus gauderio TaxID=698409 RepID=UPI004042DDF2
MAAENKPEGLKRMRNPDRTYRAAVGYAGHAPPKGVGDDAGTNNEHGHLKIYLPKKLLECLPKCSSLPKERHRWNTNEEIAAYLISFEKHEEWLTTSPKTSQKRECVTAPRLTQMGPEAKKARVASSVLVVMNKA